MISVLAASGLDTRVAFANGGPFHSWRVVAKTGDAAGSYTIASIDPNVSMNDLGEVAFVASLSGASTGQGLVSALPQASGAFALAHISFPNPDARLYSFCQINNDGRVVARDAISGGSLIRTWDSRGLSSFNIIVSTTTTTLGAVTLPARAEDGSTVFIGVNPSTALYRNTSGVRDAHSQVGLVTGGGLRPSCAAGGVALVRDGSGTTGNVIRYAPAAATVSGGFTSTGAAPGMSPDGKLVAFVGRGPAAADDGIHLAVFDAAVPGMATPMTVIDASTAISYDAAGNAIRLATFDFDSRIGVIHQEAAPAGIEGDTAILTFIATPSSASRGNPAAAGTPMFFSAGRGVWTIRVKFERELDGSIFPIVANVAGVLPCVQVGDTIGGRTITDLRLYDPIGRAMATEAGVARTPGLDDHQIVCWANSAAGAFILIGSKLDTDGDGLLDHWERVGGGIDMDRDDVVDLALAAWGATPTQRDLFLELDWSTDRTVGVPSSWSCAPAPLASEQLYNMFQLAPGGAIHLHVDAGSRNDPCGNAYSYNTGSGLLQGGDLVTKPGTGERLDVLYFGKPGLITIPTGVTAASMDEVKDVHFSTADKRARELAFRYCVMADYSGFVDAPGGPFTSTVSSATPSSLTSASTIPTTSSSGRALSLRGNICKIISGNGAGQVRVIQSVAGNVITMSQPWAGGQQPDGTSQFTLIRGNSGVGEAYFRPTLNNRSLPGNDLLLTFGGFGRNSGGWLANTCVQWRTLAHEVGHTLGLRHGGTDHEQYKGAAYLSLMSYSFQNQCPSAANPALSVVQSYSGAGDPTFNDWDNLQFGLCSSLFHLGNTFRLAPGASFEPDENFTIADYEILNQAPVDLTAPIPVITSPIAGVNVSAPLQVTVQATDNVAIGSVRIRFDANGDGSTQGSGERVVAVHNGGGIYTATFPSITGPSGSRQIEAEAFDVTMNIGTATNLVMVGGAGGDLDDDDRDGFKNLLELALGMNPNVPDSAAYPVVTTYDSSAGGRIVFTYPRNTLLPNITYAVEVSIDLLTWTTSGVSETVLGSSGGIESVQAIIPRNGETKRFVRLSITRSP